LSFRAASPVIPSLASCVIPSRRRGISAPRCAEIPRPRFARTRDDNGAKIGAHLVIPGRLPCHSEPKARNLTASIRRDPSPALRADSG
jgi:hypothetical protein